MIDRVLQIQARIREIHSLLGIEPPPNEAFEGALQTAIGAQAGAFPEVPLGPAAFQPPLRDHGLAAARTGQPFGPRVQRATAVQPPEFLRPLIQQTAAKYDLDPDLLSAVIQTESGFRTEAVSAAGARGLMQLMPGTARSLGVGNSADPRENVDAGARYLKAQITRFGSVSKGLAAYNAGPAAVRRYGGTPPFSETRSYLQRVLDLYEQFRTRRPAAPGSGVAADASGRRSP